MHTHHTPHTTPPHHHTTYTTTHHTHLEWKVLDLSPSSANDTLILSKQSIGQYFALCIWFVRVCSLLTESPEQFVNLGTSYCLSFNLEAYYKDFGFLAHLLIYCNFIVNPFSVTLPIYIIRAFEITKLNSFILIANFRVMNSFWIYHYLLWR